MSRLCGATQAIICRWVNNYRSCLNYFHPPWAIPFSPVFGDLSVTLLCVSGLESLPDSRRCTLLVAHFTHPYRMAALVLSRCCPGSTTLSSLLHGLSDCLSRYFLHLCYDWSLCLAQLTPACGVASMPIHPGCHRPFPHSVFRRSVADAYRGLPLCFLF
jgi:hypothetical protein